MHKETTYKEKFAILKEWMPQIVDDVKKDLKNEHLKNDWAFAKRYLGGKAPNKVSVQDLVEAYLSAIASEENGEQIGEFIATRWLIKHSEVYDYFEKQLSAIDPNFSELQSLNLQQSQPIIEGSLQNFGPLATYLFSVLNGVVFPKEIFDELAKKSKNEANRQEQMEREASERMSLEQIEKKYEMQLARLTDKYEKKLQGLQKKYLIDTEALKKQVSILTRKVNGK